DGAPRGLLRHAVGSYPTHLPELFPTCRTLAIHRHPPGKGRMRLRTQQPLAVRSCGPSRARFREDVLRGLGRPAKELPCKYFYDARGSQLFEAICQLDEYYLTRTELAIMGRHATKMAGRLGRRCLLVEFGSGSGRKTRLLLDHLAEPAAYVPIDISG